MSYIDESIIPGETIIYRARTHPAALFAPVILSTALMFLAATILTTRETLWVLILLFAYLLITLFRLAALFFTTEFALTNRRIIAKTGLIRRRSVEIMLSKVESLSVSRSLYGWIFHFGTVTVVGSGGTRQSFPMIADPQELRRLVNTQISTIA